MLVCTFCLQLYVCKQCENLVKSIAQTYISLIWFTKYAACLNRTEKKSILLYQSQFDKIKEEEDKHLTFYFITNYKSLNSQGQF